MLKRPNRIESVEEKTTLIKKINNNKYWDCHRYGCSGPRSFWITRDKSSVGKETYPIPNRMEESVAK